MAGVNEPVVDEVSEPVERTVEPQSPLAQEPS